MEFGIETFGDVTRTADGRLRAHAEVLRDVVAEAELAERVGVDAFGVAKHHRDDFAVPASEVLLAAIAARTERIRLGSAVTVLSSNDPVRVCQCAERCGLGSAWAARARVCPLARVSASE